MMWRMFCSLLLLSLLVRCTGDESLPEVTYSEQAPMDKREREALYSAIQGFVGDSWNGSDLYPDPCGWTPIQVFLTKLFFIRTFCAAMLYTLKSLVLSEKHRFLKIVKSLSFRCC